VTAHHWLNHAAAAILAIVAVTGVVRAQQAKLNRTTNARVEAVWGREELYWRSVQAGDVDNYRALWDDGFRGWPCKAQHTATKTNIADWVRDIRDQKVKLSYSLTREGAADFGDIVVIYYQTPMVKEYPDGRVVDRDRVFKFTHTWRKTRKTWNIIGGMCGELLPQTSP
jgi:uncharacterized protein DUF4440